jgi:hypothetical protein
MALCKSNDKSSQSEHIAAGNFEQRRDLLKRGIVFILVRRPADSKQGRLSYSEEGICGLAIRSLAETSLANASLILSTWTIAKPPRTGASQFNPGWAWQRGQTTDIGLMAT